MLGVQIYTKKPLKKLEKPKKLKGLKILHPIGGGVFTPPREGGGVKI